VFRPKHLLLTVEDCTEFRLGLCVIAVGSQFISESLSRSKSHGMLWCEYTLMHSQDGTKLYLSFGVPALSCQSNTQVVAGRHSGRMPRPKHPLATDCRAAGRCFGLQMPALITQRDR